MYHSLSFTKFFNVFFIDFQNYPNENSQEGCIMYRKRSYSPFNFIHRERYEPYERSYSLFQIMNSSMNSLGMHREFIMNEFFLHRMVCQREKKGCCKFWGY